MNVRLFRPFSAEAFAGRSRPPCGRSPCSTGRRSPGRPASRCTRTSSRALRAESRPAPVRDAEGDRRTLRPVLEGVRSGDGQGRVRRAREGSAEEPLHGRHRRRRLAHLARGRPLVHDRAGRRRARRVLRARRRRDGEREQELGEDHRRGYRPVRAGLLRLRLEEVGLDDHLAPAVRAAPHPLDVPDRLGAGQLRRLPPVQRSSSGSTSSRSRRRARRSC